MKTAISLPDAIFQEAERLARRLKKSRSELYKEAVAEYVARHEPEAVTEALNRLAKNLDTGTDEFNSANASARAGALRVVIAQGDVCWADLPDPVGSGPGFRRPVLVVQGDAFNRSHLATVVCVPLTSNLRWAEAPGNVLMAARGTGLPRDSVANVSQIVTLDRDILTERVGRVSTKQLELVFAGLDLVMGR